MNYLLASALAGFAELALFGGPFAAAVPNLLPLGPTMLLDALRSFRHSLLNPLARRPMSRRRSHRRQTGLSRVRPVCERLEQRALLSALALEVSLSAGTIQENAGPSALTGTVTRWEDDLSQAITVSLSSSDESEIRLPETVTIEAGKRQASFTVDVIDDATLDGFERVTITATVNETIVGTGTFESSFGTSGQLNLEENVNSVVPLDDGRFYSIGYLEVDTSNVSTSNLYDIVVRRFHADGTADTSFGTGGRLQIDLTGEKEIPTAAVLQTDGKLLIVGQSDNGPDADQFILRLTTSGSLDPTFGFGGRVIRGFDPDSGGFNDVAVQADGKIVAVGGIGGDLSVTRFNANGSLDTTFGTDGTVTRDFSLGDGAYGVALQTDGKIIVTGVSRGGNYDSKVILARLNTNGTFDASFGTNGIVQTDLEGEYDRANDVVIQADGKIVVAAQTDDIVTYPPVYDFVAIRYNSDGSLDSTFGGDGTVRTDFFGNDDQPIAMALSPDGSILIVGTSSPPEATNYDRNLAAITRYSADGTLLRRTQTSFAGSLLQSVVPLADGKLLLGGWRDGIYGGRLTIYDPAGTRTITTSATTSIVVFDHETLSVSIPSGLTELSFGETVTATVTRSNIDDTGPLLVRLISEDASELIVPETVEIPAGAFSATFEVRAVSNDRPDGTRTVRLAALADFFLVEPEGIASLTLSEPETTTIDVDVDGYAADMNRDGLFDAVETFRTSDGAWQLSYREDRGLLEFDVSNLAANSKIEAAGLSLDIISFSAGSPQGRVFFDIYGYAGDGALTVEDATRTGTLLGTLTLTMRDTFGRRTIALDAAALQALINSGNHVGFVAKIRTELSDVNGARIEWNTSEADVDLPNRPQLHLALSPNTPPVFTTSQYAFAVDENSPSGTSVGTVTATDSNGHGVTYAIVAGNESGVFAIDSLTGAITVADPAALDYESQNAAFALRVRATDDSVDALWSEADLLVKLLDVVENQPPVFQGTPYRFAAAENTAGGSQIGLIQVSDPNEPGVSQFEFEIVGGNENGTFQIDAQGRISLSASSSLDYETQPIHQLTVRVTDSGAGGEAPLSAETEVVVEVTNILENTAPSIGPQTFSRWAGADSSAVGTVIASDPDQDRLTYEIIGGNELGDFTIDTATGLLSVVAGRSPAEGDHVLTVRVTDDGEANLSDAADVTVVVFNTVPVAASDSFETNARRALSIAAADLLTNDADADTVYGDDLSVILVTSPSHGTLSANADGSFTYQPSSGFFGTDTFTYRLRDAVGAESETVTVTIAVMGLSVPINVDPKDSTNSINLSKDRTVQVAILATDNFDPTTVDVSSLTFGVTGAEASLTTKGNGQPRFTFRDIDGDGRLDLLVTFDVEDLGLSSTAVGGTVDLTLRGSLSDGTEFTGVESVTITETARKGGGGGQGGGRWK